MSEVDDLAMAVVKLEQANRQLEEYARVVSHELKAPLRRIQGFTSVLEEECRTDNPDVNEALFFIQDGIQAMEHVIDTLLRFARADFDARLIELVEAGDILSQVMKALDGQIASRSAVVTWDPLPMVFANRVLLEQVFTNLISNGIKFNHSTPPIVHVSAMVSGEWVRFTVQDNGEGIALEHADEVFGMFRRFHSAYEGSGVGLAFCRRAIEALGGQIGVETEPGEGSVFWFTVPTCNCGR